MVIFDDYKDAEETSKTIKQTLGSLRIKSEFKFNKCHANVRDGFFEAISKHRFRVRAIVVETERIYSINLRSSTDCFYNYFVRMLIEHDDNTLIGARIKIDGSGGDREFRSALTVYLRQYCGKNESGESKIKNLKFSDSKRDHLIQLADMCVGAIARSYNHKDKADHWR